MTETRPTGPSTAAPLGDPVPDALATYLRAIDDDRFDEAAAVFAADARYAVPLPGGIETKPREETLGRAALAQRFARRGPKPWRHAVQLCVADGHDALIEGILVDAAGAPTATFVASAQISEDGLLSRYLAFVCDGARDPIPTGTPDDVPATDALRLLHDYFDALDEGDFEGAGSCFSDDTLYSHPPYKHTAIDGAARVEFRGRRALEAAFHARGRTSFDHEILTCIQRGPHAMIEGVVTGLPEIGTGSFISSLSLAADGTIRRYVSFYCEPGVERV